MSQRISWIVCQIARADDGSRSLLFSHTHIKMSHLITEEKKEEEKRFQQATKFLVLPQLLTANRGTYFLALGSQLFMGVTRT